MTGAMPRSVFFGLGETLPTAPSRKTAEIGDVLDSWSQWPARNLERPRFPRFPDSALIRARRNATADGSRPGLGPG